MNQTVAIPAAKGVFIDNSWRPAASGRTLPVVAPAEGAVFAAIAAGDKADIDLAVAAARRAFEGGAWSRLNATERGRLLSRLGRLIEDHVDELTRLEARDTGKPMKQARADAVAVARYFEYYGGAADKLHGDTVPFLDGYFVATVWEPKGVTAHIIPWNYPGQMFGRTVAASLAVGNACVIKPAEEACQVPLRLAELAAEAGFPEGAINVVPGLGEEAGAALANHPGVDFISFTGSVEVGTLVQTAAARNHIGCTLELGGKSPQIVFADADIEAALPVVIAAVVQNAGQTCSAGSRLLLDIKIWDRFMSELASRFEKVTAGTPEMDHELGPVISAGQRARIEGMLSAAEAAGARRLAQGRIAEGAPSEGFFVRPAIYGFEDPGIALGARRSVWADSRRDAVSRRGGGGSSRQLDRLRAGRRSLVRRRQSRDAGRAQGPGGAGVRQRLRRGRGHRTAVRRRQEIRPRPRKGFCRAL